MKNRKPQNNCQKAQRPELLPTPKTPSLEDMLMRSVLNPNSSELITELERMVISPSPSGVTQLKREGMRINSFGATEKIKEKVNYIHTLADGNSINESGFVQCQTCNKIVRSASLQRCPCGQTCCISKGCGCYSKNQDQWYCSKKHALLAKLNVNLRWLL